MFERARSRARLSLLVALAGLVISGRGCGGGSGGGDVCKTSCQKYVALCAATLSTPSTQAEMSCETDCATAMTLGNDIPCGNSAAIAAAFQACNGRTTCADFGSCLAGVPVCGAMGGGGASGAAGAGAGPSGAAGTAGTIGGCTALTTCCNALATPTAVSECLQYAAPGTTDAACAGYLGILQAAGACPTTP